MEKRGLLLDRRRHRLRQIDDASTSMLDHRNEHRLGSYPDASKIRSNILFKHKMSIVNQRESRPPTPTTGTDRAQKRHAPGARRASSSAKSATSETMQARPWPTPKPATFASPRCTPTTAYHALNRIFSFYPLENRPSLLADLSVTLKCVISQRLCKKPDGGRVPAIEVLLNSRYIAELIEKGDLGEIKDAMEKSMVPGSQTFEQSLFSLYSSGVITLDEALGNADSANNLQQVINNAAAPAAAAKPAAAAAAANPNAAPDYTKSVAPGSFSEFKLNMDPE
jgi:twitching motility protein PilU